MSHPSNRHDPFETIVELTAAAMSGKPAPDYVYEPTTPAVIRRAAALIERIRLSSLEAEARFAKDPDIHQSKLLERYY